MGRLCVALLLALVSVAGCSDDCRDETCGSRALPPTAPTPNPLPEPAPAGTHRVEFRVLGDLGGAVAIRYSTSQAGTTNALSSLPWVQTVALPHKTSFLALSAGLPPQSDGLFVPARLQVQILVDGRIFREADVLSFEPAVSVSGLFDEAAVPLGVQ